MQYNKGPSVTVTNPGHHAYDVPVDGTISVTFDKDIAKISIAGNILLIDRNGEKIECYIRYANRTVTIEPRKQLAFNTSYTVVVHGDNNPNNPDGDKGIISQTGTPMLGDYRFSFTTIQSEMFGEKIFGLIPNDVVLLEIPSLKGQTTIGTINPTMTVQIEISSSNTFEAGALIWDGHCDIQDFEAGFKPNIELFDGTYYWRARSCSDTVHENYGEWSEFAQFGIETHADATVVAEDRVDIDVAFPDSWDMLAPSIIEVYPQDNRSHVKTNLRTMSVVFDQIVPEKMLEHCYITLTGNSVDDDINQPTHGEVDIQTSVIHDHEKKTTTVVIILPEIGGDV